ncbi:MAG: bifunctional UDP-N-acetylglucosamine diphosphorylase/glucosamine-1-phosphate N-acetyltransferase GlmU, partial [Clostridiales bacterium]|nr:bifunctional UDP-N-acetylglucosamine diphosphorylase/glucosamine-1-phosphate N-acetyltransferase GlmU [Clostridiales bacterium]
CEIGPNTRIVDSAIGDCVTVSYSVILKSTVGSHADIGPFAYIRPNSKVGEHCKVGDFVEVKNSTIGDYTKASHLTYIGDSDVGEHVNFGCGTVTVNYDGEKKHRTVIKDNAFIGCNTNLVAPVTVEEGAYTAAGSTITQDVPEKSLSIARARQVNKTDWTKKGK